MNEIIQFDRQYEFNSILDSVASGIIGVSPDGNLIYANRACVDLLRYAHASELLGLNIFDLIPDVLDINQHQHLIRQSLESQESQYCERSVFVRKDQTLIDVECWVRPHQLADGTRGVVLTFNDVSDRLVEKAGSLISKKALDASMNAVGIAGTDGIINYVNESFLKFWNAKTQDQVLGKRLLDFWPDPAIGHAVNDAVLSQGQWQGEIEGKQLDGNVIHARVSAALVKDDVGKPIGMLASFIDITQQKKAEATRQRLFDIVDAASELVMIVDLNGKITFMNRGGMIILGLADQDCNDCNLFEFLTRSDADLLRSAFDDKSVSNLSMDIHIVTRSLEEKPMALTLVKHAELEGDREQYVSILATDISAYKQLIFDLQTSEETFAKAQEIAHIGNWDWNILTNDLSWSDEIYRIFGIPPQQFQATYPAFLQAVHPDDQDNVVEAVNSAVADENVQYSIEHRVVRPDGEVRIVHERGKVYRDVDGQPVRMLGTVHDITDRKQKEEEIRKLNEGLERRVEDRTRELQKSLETLRTTQLKLVESEKMASLGNLVAGVAHEINTPIGVGVSASTFLADETRKQKQLFDSGELLQEQFEKYLGVAIESTGMIESNLKRAADLIRSFKQVAVDQSSEERRRINLQNYLQELVITLSPSLRRDEHVVDIKGDPELTLMTFPGAISQIVTNLIMNSITHGFEDRKQGHILIDYSCDGNNVEMNYRDDGCGVDEKTLSQIYEPFFTTKRGRGGSGLGMYIIYNLVTQQLGGTIHVSSRSGQGLNVMIRWQENQEASC